MSEGAVPTAVRCPAVPSSRTCSILTHRQGTGYAGRTGRGLHLQREQQAALEAARAAFSGSHRTRTQSRTHHGRRCRRLRPRLWKRLADADLLSCCWTRARRSGPRPDRPLPGTARVSEGLARVPLLESGRCQDPPGLRPPGVEGGHARPGRSGRTGLTVAAHGRPATTRPNSPWSHARTRTAPGCWTESHSGPWAYNADAVLCPPTTTTGRAVLAWCHGCRRRRTGRTVLHHGGTARGNGSNPPARTAPPDRHGRPGSRCDCCSPPGRARSRSASAKPCWR